MVNHPAQDLKPWPKRITKAFLYKAYKLSHNEIKKRIHFAIEETNKTSGLKMNFHKNFVTPKQLIIIVEELGNPPGYVDL